MYLQHEFEVVHTIQILNKAIKYIYIYITHKTVYIKLKSNGCLLKKN